jgi:hypothetical protein
MISLKVEVSLFVPSPEIEDRNDSLIESVRSGCISIMRYILAMSPFTTYLKVLNLNKIAKSSGWIVGPAMRLSFRLNASAERNDALKTTLNLVDVESLSTA